MAQAIEIHTRTDDTATVDGHLIHRGHYATIYDAALAHVVTRAQELGRPVPTKATDGVDSGHTFWITVSPDGAVEPAEPPADEQLALGAAPAARAGGRRHRSEPKEVDENDFYPAQQEAPLDHGSPAETGFVDTTPWTPTIAPAAVAPVDVGPRVVSASPNAGPSPVHDQTASGRHEPRTGPIRIAPGPAQTASSREPYAPQAQQHAPQPHQPAAAPAQQAPWYPQQSQMPPSAPAGPPPSLADLRASRPNAPEAPATSGWRGGFNRATGGLLKLSPSEDELRLRRARDAVQRSLRGPRTVVVINTKGGGGKTTAVYSLAATFGQARGGYVLGWDNNETRGTLAWRSAPARHTNTAVDLLRDLERFEDPRNARVGDLDNYVRAQGSAQFDVLASDENAASAASIDDAAFRSLHRSLSRFYRILVIDTGNNVKAPNWGAAVDLADQLVVVSSVREDTAGGASWTLDHLAEIGLGDKVRNAVTILSAPKAAADPDQRAMQARFRQHFAARTRTVLDVPFDPALVDGDSIVFEALSPATRQAWLIAAAAIAEEL